MKEFVFINYSMIGLVGEEAALCINPVTKSMRVGTTLKDKDLAIISEDNLEKTRDLISKSQNLKNGWWFPREIEDRKFVYSHYSVLDKLMKFEEDYDEYVVYFEKDNTYLGIKDGILTWIDFEETGLNGNEFGTPFNNPEEAIIHLLILGASSGIDFSLCPEDICNVLEGLRNGKFQLYKTIYKDDAWFLEKVEPDDVEIDEEEPEEKVSVIDTLKNFSLENCKDLYAIMCEINCTKNFVCYDNIDSGFRLVHRENTGTCLFVTPFDDLENIEIHLGLLESVDHYLKKGAASEYYTAEDIVVGLRSGQYKIVKVEYDKQRGELKVASDDIMEIPIPEGYEFKSANNNKIILKKS